MMGTGQDSVKVMAVVDKPEKEKVLSKKKNGFWFRFKLMFSCISSRSKVDSSTLVEPKTVTEKREGDPPSCNGSTTPLISGELKYSSKLRIFMFNDLKLATRNFRPESLLGEGGFGCVFKGWIEENGTAPVKPGTGLTVAVKTLNPDGLQGHKEWLAEINFLGNLVHPSLVKLVGYCMEDDQRLLVYEFMPRGSLENHLFRSM
ncbi:hypothetical protein BRARA_I00313 [Brassica rapa]|uniref:non-specific serine/threonine protein kinase n=1 Tax=Brassica campestris TaxID=3711 RepID=A0A397XQH0_BRACM|nr:hypothetical protein BRARA_I00313 [Brassica rapa]